MSVACAPYGGPVAVTRDPNKIVPVKGTAKPVIRIFDTAGQELGKIWVHRIIELLNLLSNILSLLVESWSPHFYGLVRHRRINMCTGGCPGVYL